MAKSRCQWAMHSRVVKCQSAVEMSERFGGVAHAQQGITQQTMSNHHGSRRCLLLCECEELSRKGARSIAVEVDKLRYEETVEDGVQ